VVSIWKEFRDFAFAGSVIDLAVGIIIGGAFGKIVHSLVNDIIMPPIGWLLSGVDFANIFILLKRGKKNKITQSRYKSLTQAKEDGAVTINIGVFLNSILNFVVISVIIFTFVRTINKLKKKKEPTSKQCPYCYSKIDQRAIRCAFCTSQLKENFNYLIKEEEEEEEEEEKEKEKQKEAEDLGQETNGKWKLKNIKKEWKKEYDAAWRALPLPLRRITLLS